MQHGFRFVRQSVANAQPGRIMHECLLLVGLRRIRIHHCQLYAVLCVFSLPWGFGICLTLCTALLEEASVTNSHGGEADEQLREYSSCCAMNIENSLAGLSLFFNRSHNMALALVLGVSSNLLSFL